MELTVPEQVLQGGCDVRGYFATEGHQPEIAKAFYRRFLSGLSSATPTLTSFSEGTATNGPKFYIRLMGMMNPNVAEVEGGATKVVMMYIGEAFMNAQLQEPIGIRLFIHPNSTDNSEDMPGPEEISLDLTNMVLCFRDAPKISL